MKRPMATILMLSMLLTSCGKTPAPASEPRLVRAMKVADLGQLEGQWLPGQAKATREVELSFRVGGRMISRPVLVGDELEKGDLVARIDPTDYRVVVRNAEGRVDEATANLRAAQADYDRLVRARRQDPGAVSATAVDRALEERDRAQANIKSLAADLADARNRLGYTELRAPFAGTVVARYAEAYEDVRPNQPIIRLVDKSAIEFVVNVPENIIGLIPEVTDIQVLFDAFPSAAIPARLKEIGTEASATTRTYPVNLIMDQPDGFTVQPGMAGRATGKHVADTVTIVVPLSSLFTGAGDNPAEAFEARGLTDAAASAGGPMFVWSIDEQALEVRRRRVQIGAIGARGVQVIKGLAPGDWIATAGVHYLREGQKVRISQAREG